MLCSSFHNVSDDVTQILTYQTFKLNTPLTVLAIADKFFAAPSEISGIIKVSFKDICSEILLVVKYYW